MEQLACMRDKEHAALTRSIVKDHLNLLHDLVSGQCMFIAEGDAPTLIKMKQHFHTSGLLESGCNSIIQKIAETLHAPRRQKEVAEMHVRKAMIDLCGEIVLESGMPKDCVERSVEEAAGAKSASSIALKVVEAVRQHEYAVAGKNHPGDSRYSL